MLFGFSILAINNMPLWKNQVCCEENLMVFQKISETSTDGGDMFRISTLTRGFIMHLQLSLRAGGGAGREQRGGKVVRDTLCDPIGSLSQVAPAPSFPGCLDQNYLPRCSG
jgi:hypothetical protein